MTAVISSRTPQQALAALLDRYAPERLLLIGADDFPALQAFQILVAAVSPLWGNNPVSDPLEFWMYLITDAMMMPAAIVFALADKTRWANYGIALVSFANAVMLYRMDVLWNGH